MLNLLFNKEILPDAQPKPPLAQLQAISSFPVPDCLGEEANPHLDTISFQAIVGSNKVTSEHLFL